MWDRTVPETVVRVVRGIGDLNPSPTASEGLWLSPAPLRCVQILQSVVAALVFRLRWRGVGLDALIASVRAVGVAAQVLQHLAWSAQRGLGMHHRVVAVKLLVAFGPSHGVVLRIALDLLALM